MILTPHQLTAIQFVFVAIAGCALFGHAERIREAIQDFANRFGGPGSSPPTHPLQADDAFIVLRRREKRGKPE